MPSGRKSLKDEIQILKRYADLTEPYFKFLKECLEKGTKEEKRWAADNLKGAFTKMIPQTIDGEGENGEVIVKVVSYGSNPTLPLPTTNLSTSPTPGD